jgi:23S rRNA pseudouridine1911/1915/1917 synthase
LQPLRFPAGEHENGERLDQFVSRMTGITRTGAQRLIAVGAVRVDGNLQQKNHRLRPGEWVEVESPEPEEAEPIPQDIPISVLYQDGELAVIDKPAGLVVHPAAGHRDGTLVNALLYALDDLSGIGGVQRPGIVHRLDRDTSGLMVVAKTDFSHVKLQEMVQDRSLKRYYLALVHGLPATRLGTIDAPIGRDPGDRKRMAVTAAGGKTATTHFKVEKDFAECALLEIELVTGRTHQIRVHLSYIGHPVVGDNEYGVRGRLERELALDRQFLHAYRLIFLHPVSGKELSFESPLPGDLERALRRLETG